MDIKSKIISLVEAYLENPEHFIVDVHVSGSGKHISKVTVLLDGDKGISIEDCSKLSRKLGNEIEELNLIDSAYLLEVSTPGVDKPLQSVRQYKKNIGRKLSVTLLNDMVKIGQLEEVKDESILLNEEVKAGKKITIIQVEIPFKDMKKTNVLVSFN